MKKRIFAILLCLFMTFCQVNVYAASPYDSVILDSDEENSVRVYGDEPVVKAYYDSFWFDFADKTSIYQIVENSSYEQYLVYSFCTPIYTGAPRIMEFRNGELCHIDYGAVRYLIGEFFKYAVYPEYVLGPNTRVLETYCLNGLMSREGFFIYYVTDNGDYVLYKPLLDSDDIYLVPAQQMHTIATSVIEFYNKYAGMAGEYYPIEALAEYKITPDIFYLLVSPVLLICFIPVFVRNKRRKRAGLKHV